MLFMTSFIFLEILLIEDRLAFLIIKADGVFYSPKAFFYVARDVMGAECFRIKKGFKAVLDMIEHGDCA